MVGRIAAIIIHRYIEKWKNSYIRFGWIDLEDEEEIAKKKLTQVEIWLLFTLYLTSVNLISQLRKR